MPSLPPSTLTVDVTISVADQATGAGVAGDAVLATLEVLLSQDLTALSAALGFPIAAVSAMPTKTYGVAVEITNPNAMEIAGPTSEPMSAPDGLGAGAIAGIVIGVLAVLVIVGLVAYYLSKGFPKKVKAKKGPTYTATNAASAVSAASADEKI